MPKKNAPAKKTEETKKAPRKRRARNRTWNEIGKIEHVDVTTLVPHKKNPRRGNVEAIKDSLQVNGQFQPIVVQKSTNTILSGNHTWLAAKKLGWEKIAVVKVDVNDADGDRILLAANRTNDLATYDVNILAEILNSLEEPDLGTGYNDESVQSILQSLTEGLTEEVQDVVVPRVEVTYSEPSELTEEYDEIEEHGLGRSPVIDDEEDDEPFESAPEELPGQLDLKPTLDYEHKGDWGIPLLRKDMLVKPEEVPENLLAWAGSATKDWPDPDQWWLYNFGIDSTSGMRDVSKIIMSFYTYDDYFEIAWDQPDKFTAKMLNSGVRMAVMPDYSQWADDPRAVSLYNVFRCRWLARYFQEAGIKIIPNLSWRFGDRKYQQAIVLDTLPKKLPLVAMQLQTYDPKSHTADEADNLSEMIVHAIDSLGVEHLLLYAGRPGYELYKSLNFKNSSLKIQWIQTRNAKLSEQSRKRAKKKTL